jgi:cytochrome c-type biogenesis protein CcmH/NrfF
MLAQGMSVDEARDAFAKKYSTRALAVPPNSGAMRAVWMLPLAAIAAGAFGVVLTLRRWRRREDDKDAAQPAKGGKKAKRDEYDDKLDAELKGLDDE